MSDGTNYNDTYDDTYGFAVGLATGIGTAPHPVPGPRLATAVGRALQPSIRPNPPLPKNLGAYVTPVDIDTAAFRLPDYSAAITLPYYGGGAVPVTIDASFRLANIGGSAASLSGAYGGTLTLTNNSAVLVGWTMQNVNLTLAENNDESISVAITQNGTALSLSGATINMYLKTAAGTADGSALLLSSAGGSPAITITNSAGGLCTVLVPRADLFPETYTFYRIDVVFSGLQNTCVYGNIAWITL